MKRLASVDLRRVLPFAVLGVAILALFIVPSLHGTAVDDTSVYAILQHFATYSALALGLGVLMIAGEFDLSVSAMFALGAMVAVRTGTHAPVLGALIALMVGAVVGLIQGGLVARLAINSMPVTVGGYIALLGLTQALGHDTTVGFTNYNAGAALDQQVGSVFSPRSLAAILIFAAAAWLLSWTRWGRDIRAVGGDRRAARTAGVRVNVVVVAIFMASSALISLAGASVGYSLAGASAELGSLSNLIYAATAALLGGVALSGGVGSVAGIAAGALSLSILQEILDLCAAPTYMSQLITGGLLLITAVIAAPQIRFRRRRPTKPIPAGGAS